MLINKYKPGSLKEIFGHNSQIQELKKNILLKKPVLIYGGTGIGKTATVYALCNDLDYEILEVNSSDLRNKEQMQKVIDLYYELDLLENKFEVTDMFYTG